jgi:hypothetical protein
MASIYERVYKNVPQSLHAELRRDTGKPALGEKCDCFERSPPGQGPRTAVELIAGGVK